VRSHDPIVIPPKRPQVLQFGATAQDARIEEDAIEFFGVRFETSKWLLRETHNLANASMAALMAYAYLEQIQHPTVVKAVQDRQTDFIAKRTVYSGRRELPSRAMPPVIIEVLAKFAGIRHRMEFLGERNGVRVINNSMCTNPDAVIKSVTSVRDSVHVLLGGVNKDLDFRPVKALLGNRRHQAYLFGRDAKQIQDQIGGLGETFDTMQEAFRAATEKAARGEVIMLAPGCASSDQFRDFRHRGDVFIELAKEWLHNEKEPTDT
jgi:UDP-N-acetylmuramoylalanine--D-glutamate ligase